MEDRFKLKDILYSKHNYKIIRGKIFIDCKYNCEEIDRVSFSKKKGLKKVIEDIYKNYEININELLLSCSAQQVQTLHRIDADIVLYFNTYIGEEGGYGIIVDIVFQKEQKRKDNKMEDNKMGDNKMEENKIKCPDHYKLNVSGVENGVNDVIKAVKKKMDDNHIECDKLEFHWYSDAIEYLLRAYFKGQKESDLKKAISEIQFILDNKYL